MSSEVFAISSCIKFNKDAGILIDDKIYDELIVIDKCSRKIIVIIDKNRKMSEYGDCNVI